MKLLNTIPPIYHKLHEQFGVEWGNIIVAYHPNIYCAKDIPKQKIVHECIHLVQQEKMGVDNWWNMYLFDPSFRLQEELLAYSEEVEWIKNNVPTRNERRFLLDILYTDFSSSIYGSIISYNEAKRLLA